MLNTATTVGNWTVNTCYGFGFTVGRAAPGAQHQAGLPLGSAGGDRLRGDRHLYTARPRALDPAPARRPSRAGQGRRQPADRLYREPVADHLNGSAWVFLLEWEGRTGTGGSRHCGCATPRGD